MAALGVADLLRAWERAYAQRPAQRALTLVGAAFGEEMGDPGALSIGERDALLLRLREATFGPGLECIATCAACGETLELRFKTGDVQAQRSPAPGRPLAVDGYEVEWRLPTGRDVAGLAPEEGLEAARARLIEGCVVRASRGDEAVAPRDLPQAVRDALAQAVQDADPQADVELALACPACAHDNVVRFDAPTFFWDELNAWAHRTLREVHVLAASYGWSERDVLAMTPFRRQVYLEMLDA